MFLQLLDGVAFLHQLGIAHRDIKPENIVCSNDGQNVYICDFGLATSEVRSSEFGCGSTFYIAPECLGEWFPSRATYPTRPGDVWSLGIILVNLVCGRNPWRIAAPSDESFGAFIKDPEFLRRILPISEECLDILTCIFTIDPADRISLPELRKLILSVESFTMNEEELRETHLAAQPKAEETWTEEVFAFDQETPSLRADSGSPSPMAHRSRTSSSNGGSLPPTPLLSAEAIGGLPSMNNTHLWDMLKPGLKEQQAFTSPDHLSANPFFR